MSRAILAVALCGLLCSCATAPVDHVVTQEVRIAIPTPCAADPGPEPVWWDDDAKIASVPLGDIETVAKLMKAGQIQHREWEARLKAANAGCQAVAPASPTK